jgi:hypothetical protein
MDNFTRDPTAGAPIQITYNTDGIAPSPRNRDRFIEFLKRVHLGPLRVWRTMWENICAEYTGNSNFQDQQIRPAKRLIHSYLQVGTHYGNHTTPLTFKGI